MTQPPPYPQPDGYPPPDPHGGYGAWQAAPPAPAWAPAWEPRPVPFAGPVFQPPAQRPPNRGAVIALVAAGGALVGAVVAGLVVAVLFSAAAERIGQGMGEEFSQSVESSLGIPPEGAWSSTWGPTEPVDEYPPTAPGVLGPDPVLDGYATSCFEGELQACDDLYYESPPLSDYEQYAVTCGGRVKQFAVAACTDLD